MPRDLPPDHPPALIAQIMEIILASPYRTVHYTGGADEGLLRALLAQRERLELSVMDMPNRWGGATRFFWDEFESCGMEYPEVPEWQEGIPFYQEGAPDHDIGLRDWPWDSPRQLGRIVRFSGRRPPRLLVLFGRAESVKTGEERIFEDGELKLRTRDVFETLTSTHPAYSWQTVGGVRVGRWRRPPAVDGQGSQMPDAKSQEEDAP